MSRGPSSPTPGIGSWKNSRNRPSPSSLSSSQANEVYVWIAHARSAADECQQVGVDHVGVRRAHPVRQLLVHLQRPVLQEFCRKRSGIVERNDLIVIPMHHQRRNANRLEIFGEVGL